MLQRQLDRMNQLQGLFLCHNQQAQLQVNNKDKSSFKQALNQITAINVVLKSGLVSEAMDELLIKSNLTYLEKLVS